jgi:hypothetical protein
MEINKEALDFLKVNLYGGCLESFGVKKQFIELEFSNSRFEEIKFFIDCPINTPETETMSLISSLKNLNKDTFEISYFLKANLKCIEDCSFDDCGNFRIDFENGYIIIFDLSKNKDANLSITFKVTENSKILKAVDIMSEGVVKMN